ncbi:MULTISPECIES: outer membrane beta-barrel protein [unclassified Novosphingobium]|uniref:outer membrane beta-barrel protein n=1 Tax=unclassified Novosphingobium TaxID=2644732 RepID=UPI00135733C1|nr:MULTISPECIES: outer membrane beta-barrel protein [unclassified Novosphingobium]
MCITGLRTSFAVLALSIAWSPAAEAQNIGPLIREPNDVPGSRIISEYKQIGYDIAGFQVLPTVTFGVRGDDNVFTRTSVKESDNVLQAEPRLQLRKQNRFYNISVGTMVRTSSYLKLTSQDSTEYSLEGTYTLGTTSPNSIAVNVGYRREAIMRGTVENDLAGGEPLMRRVLHGSFTGRKQFNRVAIDAQVLSIHQRYEDLEDSAGTPVDQHFRNVTRYGVQGIASYEISSRTAIFLGVEYDRFNYALSRRLVNRDAENWSGTAGVRYEISRLIYAQLGFGYRRYNFKDPAFGAIAGLAVWGHLRYFPSRVLAVRGSIEQSNTTSPYDLVGAVTLTTAKIEAEYEMRRSLSWLAATKFTLEDYGKQPYSARRFDVSAGPRLRFSRWLSANASAGYTRRFVNGSAPFEPYSQFYGLISVTLAR